MMVYKEKKKKADPSGLAFLLMYLESGSYVETKIF